MKRAFELVTLVLAVLAIVFAVKQYYDSRGLMESNKALTDKVQYLLGTASTKYVDEFPQDIAGIQDVIAGTCQDLDIMVSVPGYAEYSSPRDFDRYKAALIAVAKSTLRENRQAKKCLGKKIDPNGNDDGNPRVRLLVFRPVDRKTMLEEQFRKEAFLAELQRTNSSARQQFLTFFNVNRRLISDSTPEAYLQKVENGAYSDFLERLEKLHHINEEQYCNEGVVIRYSTQRFSTYLWLQDHEQAAFSFPSNRITFRTSDQKLIDVFRSIFDEEWTKATPFDESDDPALVKR